MAIRKCTGTLDLVTLCDHYSLNGRRPGDFDALLTLAREYRALLAELHGGEFSVPRDKLFRLMTHADDVITAAEQP